MDLFRQNRSGNSVPALPADTVLQDRYAVTECTAQEHSSITYLAKHRETGMEFSIIECLPENAVRRGEDGAAVLSQTGFQEYRARFLAAAKKLKKYTAPHMPVLTEYIEENGTVYCVFPRRAGRTLQHTEFPRTAGYLRSLGIALCETFASLHNAGLYYGRLTSAEICIFDGGEFQLSPLPLLEHAAEGNADRTSDMHILTSYLSGLQTGFISNEDESHDAAILRNVLQYGYQDAELLRDALICADDSLNKPRTSRRSRRPAILAVLCALFLLLGTAGAVYLGRDHLPLSLCTRLGLIREDVISVWMPMDTALDESEIQGMYQKLTAGFERSYPGFGVNLVIYADDSFGNALDFAATGEEPPVVFMNASDEIVQEAAADLTLLTDSLETVYLADMTSFDTIIPLGCSLPALYYNAYTYEETDQTTIEYDDIDESVCYDASVSQLIQLTGGNHTESPFSAFLQNRSDAPLLASTTCLAAAERSAINSGAVRMLPVALNGAYALQYEMYCSINKDKDWNSQRIGMLWIQYLLTEEAQQIMFAEYYSALPLHEEVLTQTIENHESLSVIREIQEAIDTESLRQGGAR